MAALLSYHFHCRGVNQLREACYMLAGRHKYKNILCIHHVHHQTLAGYQGLTPLEYKANSTQCLKLKPLSQVLQIDCQAIHQGSGIWTVAPHRQFTVSCTHLRRIWRVVNSSGCDKESGLEQSIVRNGVSALPGVACAVFTENDLSALPGSGVAGIVLTEKSVNAVVSTLDNMSSETNVQQHNSKPCSTYIPNTSDNVSSSTVKDFKQDANLTSNQTSVNDDSKANLLNITGMQDTAILTELADLDIPSPAPGALENGSLKQDFELELARLPPQRPMEPSFNLAPYVLQSPVLQKLISLGVDLSAVEKVKLAADMLVQCDWDVDIQPRLLFLKDVGVEEDQLGRVISKNPLLLSEDIDNMQVRISYLQSKKFAKEQLCHIVNKAPLTLIMPVTSIDSKLGFLQRSFHLTGDEVRLVATRLPKIIPWRLQKLKDIRFYIKEFLGFSDKEQKAMLLSAPKVYLSDKYQLGKQFDFLHNTMDRTHHQIVQWPKVFRTRLHIIKQRHRFLLMLGQAQYDASKENYVSLQALVSGRDDDFCRNVAKASLGQYQNFLKCL